MIQKIQKQKQKETNKEKQWQAFSINLCNGGYIDCRN